MEPALPQPAVAFPDDAVSSRLAGPGGAVAALVVSVLAVACAPVDDVATQRAAIYGGVSAVDDHAVFMLEPLRCSAALIAPRTLLTAAHCVDEPTRFATNAVDGVSGPLYPVVKVQSYTGVRGDWSPDLALVLLERAPPVTPLRWQATGPFPPIGAQLRHVGYGLTETGVSGQRRTVTVPIRGTGTPQGFGVSVMSGEGGRGICFGDSGGPALLRDDQGERVVAVHSYGYECGGLSGSALVYPYAAFVSRWLGENEQPSCARDTRCVPGCAPADLDCVCGPDGQCSAACTDGDDPDCPPGCRPDGVCQPVSVCPADLDCLPPGTRCLRELQCSSRLCVADAQNPTRYCSVPCEAGRCPAGFQCDAARMVCIKSQRATVAPGFPCVAGDLCADGYRCAAPMGMTARCEKACVAGSECLAGFRCDFSLGVCTQRAPVTLDAGLEWTEPLAPQGCGAAPAGPLAWAIVAVARRWRRHPSTRVAPSRGA
ncbi:MAG: trypsin-like serine protease [Myxococcaceae bacterium]|nr:trypsin-like serine protease [Myxococcaceae bacterium]